MKISIYFRDNYIKSDNTSPLYLRVFIGRKYLFVPIDIDISSDNFDKKKNIVKSGPNKIIYNNLIKRYLGEAANIILKYQVNKKTLTRELFIKEFRNPSLLTDFYAFMEEQIRLREGEITQTSAKQHTACLEKLKRFRKTLAISELDEKFIREFEIHMKTKLNNNSNTVYNSLKTLRTYINRAIKMELMGSSPFKFYKPKKVLAYPEFLTQEELLELERIYNIRYLPERYHKVLRWFLFSCYTGLRISDLRRVKYENIESMMLKFRPLKTININNKQIEVPLIDKAFNLIKDEFQNRMKGLLFECYTDQVMNRHLIDIMEVAKITKKVSFHTARHTFATLFLKNSKRADGILILKKLLGHSNIETTMVYTHVLNEDIKDAMANFLN